MKIFDMRYGDTYLWFALLLAIGGFGFVYSIKDVNSEPDYRDGVGAGVFVESKVTSDVHVPIVSTIPAASAPFVSTLITSGTSAMAFTTSGTITTAFDILEMRVHMNATGATETLVMSLDHVSGSEFDIVLLSQAMTSVTDVVFRPVRPVPVASGTLFLVTLPNAAGKTWGGELTYTIP